MWLLRGGRGGGKTKTEVEDASRYLAHNPGHRLAVVTPTFADARDTVMEGESGLLNAIPDSALRGGSRDKAWNRSIGELFLANGSQVRCYSSERPDRLRGPQHHRALVDEPASFADAHRVDEQGNPLIGTTWTNLLLGLRLGESPRVVVAGTPKTVGLYSHLVSVADVTSLLTTYENLDNLAPTFAAAILDRYKGTRLERQELLGELLTDVEGAMWTWPMIEPYRVASRDLLPEMARVVVGVDPAASHGPGSAETGIIVAGMGVDGRLYVMADYSCRSTPEGWASRVGVAADEWDASLVVAERNNGGEMVGSVLRHVRPDLRVKLVWASKGKTTRAEPIVAWYEQGRTSHLVGLSVLESQQTTWVAGDPSPDRVDAGVWAATELIGRRQTTLRVATGPLSTIVPSRVS